MSSYISDNRILLGKRHYIRRTAGADYWFDFTVGKMRKYQEEFGDNFCVVLYASDTKDDAYIIPYKELKPVFLDNLIDKRGRWTGTIRENVLGIYKHPSPGRFVAISAYYNALELLDIDIKGNNDGKLENSNLMEYEKVTDPRNLRHKITEFNNLYRDVAPQRRITISEQISRPGLITDYLKKLQKYTCQICAEQGFKQKNGSMYIEAHHIIELHYLIPGSYCSDNIIIVCPTCHRKLHYADVQYKLSEDSLITLQINQTEYVFSRILLSDI